MSNLRDLLDDPEIGDDEVVYRLVSWGKLPGGKDAVSIGEEAQLHRNAFTDYPAAQAAELGLAGPCMSVVLKSVLEAGGRTAIDLIGNRDDCGVAETTVGQLRSLAKDGETHAHGVMSNPTEAEPGHAVVFQLSGGKRGKSAEKLVAAVFTWTIPLRNGG